MTFNPYQRQGAVPSAPVQAAPQQAGGFSQPQQAVGYAPQYQAAAPAYAPAPQGSWQGGGGGYQKKPQQPGNGMLYTNTYKNAPNKPDFTGKFVHLDGKEYAIAMWVRQDNKGGNKFSVKVSVPKPKQGGAPAVQGGYSPQWAPQGPVVGQGQASGVNYGNQGMNDEIPFDHPNR